MELRLDDVTMRFAGLIALNAVSLAISQRETVGLIGPNGSGKTTLLNVASGVLRPSAGKVSLGEHSWREIPVYKSARLGIRRTFQNIRLFADLTVLETVEVPLAALRRPSRRQRALEVLNEIGLIAYRDRVGRTLSYGLQRRLEIARALAGEPQFLLLDEPTAGLSDIESQQLVEVVLDACNQRGCGVLLIEHNLRVVMGVSDRVAVLNEGVLIAEGNPSDVRHDEAVIRAYLG